MRVTIAVSIVHACYFVAGHFQLFLYGLFNSSVTIQGYIAGFCKHYGSKFVSEMSELVYWRAYSCGNPRVVKNN